MDKFLSDAIVTFLGKKQSVYENVGDFEFEKWENPPFWGVFCKLGDFPQISLQINSAAQKTSSVTTTIHRPPPRVFTELL